MAKKCIIELIGAEIYQRESLILRDVDLCVEEGEFIYVIGKVGTGKSSLIKTLHAEIPLFTGIGKIAGFALNDIRQKDVAALRKKTGVVFQDFRLLTDRSVYKNLEFVLKATGWKDKSKIESRIGEVLESAGIQGKEGKMPHELSGGEQQRVVIARAVLNYPDIVLADEPTGNLDPETSEQILDLFIQLNNEGKTIVMATHDYAVISNKPARTLVCKDGKIEDSSQNKTLIQFEDLLKENV